MWRALSGRCFAQPGMCEKSYFRIASVCQFHHFRPSQGVFLQWEIFCRHLISGATRCRVMSRTQGCAAAQSLLGGWRSSKAPQREGLLCISFFQMRRVYLAHDLAPGLPGGHPFLGLPPFASARSRRACASGSQCSPRQVPIPAWSGPHAMRRPREQPSARKLRRPLNTAALESFS